MHKYRQKYYILCILMVLALAISGCGSKSSDSSGVGASPATATPSASVSPSPEVDESNRVITDSTGKQVTIPAKIERVADLWFAHNEVVIMLGAGDKIVASSNTAQAYPWMYKVNPAMKDAVSIVSSEFNVEQLLAVKPDVVFTSTSDKNADAIENAGIPVVRLSFTNFESMKACITLTGEILGADAAKKAQQYNELLDSKLASITSVTSKLGDAEKPKILHVSSLSPLSVDGANTIIDDWIQTAGGINAAAELESNMKEVTIEQILKWDPDMIILGASVGNIEKVTADAMWKDISAVKNNKVYLNPNGVFLWDRYGAEEVLQIQWAAKTLHPELFPDLDIAGETKSFYKEFLGYELSDTEVAKILAAEKPE